MATNKRPILDFYLKSPLLVDVLLIIVMWVLCKFLHFIPFVFTDKNTLLNIASSVIGTCVSLAGFILAALTIIVTVRSNIMTRDNAPASNAMELVISSGYYNKIVKVYTWAIYEFLFVSFGLYFFWLSIDTITDTIIQTKIVLSGVFLTGASVFRSLWVLFSILNLERFNNE